MYSPKVANAIAMQVKCSQLQSRNVDLAARLESFLAEDIHSKAARNGSETMVNNSGECWCQKTVQAKYCALHIVPEQSHEGLSRVFGRQ